MTTTRDSQRDNQAFGNLAGQLVPAADLERTVEESQFGPPLIRMHGTSSGIPLASSYGPEPAEGGADSPGEYPFTRGLTTNGFRNELWHRDIYAGFGNAEDAGKRFEALLRGGASGVNIALDLPTQLGFDSDHPDELAETGKVGV